MVLVKYLFIAYVFLTCLVWAYVIPFNEGPDEYSHYDVAAFMARNHRFPVFGVDPNMGVSVYEIPGVVLKQNASYASMPPLAYIWQAIWLTLVPWPDATDYLVARFANVLLIVGYSWLVWSISDLLFDVEPLRWLLRAVLILTPQVLFTFGYVNSDAMLLVLSAGLWWWLFRLVDRQSSVSLSYPYSILLGMLIGLAVLTRYNMAPLLLIMGWVIGWRLWSQEAGKGLNGLRKLMVIGVTALTLCGWWYVRNWILYQDLLGHHPFWQTYYMLYPRGSLPWLWTIVSDRAWWWDTWVSLWGSFGWHTLQLPEWIYRGLLVVLIVGAVGLKRGKTMSRFGSREIWLMVGSLMSLTLLFSLYQSWQYAYQPQGRYLYPAWVGLGMLMTMGVGLVPKRWQSICSYIGVLGLFGLQLYALLGVVIPHYY